MSESEANSTANSGQNKSTMNDKKAQDRDQATGMATDDKTKRTSDVVPNADPSKSSNRVLDEKEVQDQTFAAYKKEKELREASEARLAELEARVKASDEQAEKARLEAEAEAKKVEEQKLESERKRRETAIEAAFEKIQNNSGEAFDSKELMDEKNHLLDMAKDAKTQREFERIGSVLGIAVRASESAAERRKDERQQELSMRLAEINGTLSAPPPSSIASSGGTTMSRHQQGSVKRERQYDDGIESGTERASSSFNIFGASARAAAEDQKRTVRDVIPDQKQEEATGNKPVDMSAGNWAEQVFDDFTGAFKQMPSLQTMLQGGVRVEERVMMSANGPKTEKQLMPRLSVPLPAREYSMKTCAPDLFKFIVDGVNAAVGTNGKRLDANVLQELGEKGRLDENGRAVHLTRFTGPLPQDGFTTLGHSMGVF